MTDWNKVIEHPLFSMGFFFVIRQIIKTLSLDNVEYVGVIRTLYLGSQLLIILLSFYLLSVIKGKNDTTTLKYVEAGDKLVNTTVMEYDIEQVKKQMKQSFTSITIISFLHLNFGYIQPLIMQGLMGYKTFFMSKEARIHLFNASTTSGDLRRPFRIDSYFTSEKNQPKTDKGSIKRAEKALKSQ